MRNMENSSFRSLYRIFGILEILSENPDGLTMMQIIEALNKPPKSSVYTLLQQMVQKRYVTYLEHEKKYKIGPAMVKLSAIVMARHTIQKQARPSMEKLARLTGEDIYLGVMDGDRICYIDKVEGNQSIRLNINVGAARYLHSSCIGKLLLAYLDKEEQKRIIDRTGLPPVSRNTITDPVTFFRELESIRAKGISITNEESIDGVIGIAAPIRNNRNEVIAGICISAPVGRVVPIKDKLIEVVKEAANEISEQIGYESRES